MRAPTALTIAGSDPSGGAGIQADLKTFAAYGVYGASVVTALTVQTTLGVRASAAVDPALVAAQLDAVLDDLDVAAVKTGMLATRAIVEAVAERLAARRGPQLVVDPVLAATSGDRLLDADAVAALRARLLPLATLVTPNLAEAAALTGRRVTRPDEMRDAARALVGLGARAALVKGGHLAGEALDVLADADGVREHVAPRVSVPGPLHGAGCTLSAAVVAGLVLGWSLDTAVSAAKDYVTRAIGAARAVGQGAWPLAHAVGPRRPG
jgi:hydroxymethylpyrimidine/phosphomethylpyrimidine kinase